MSAICSESDDDGGLLRDISDGLLLHLTVFDYRRIWNPLSVYYAFGLPSMYRAQSDGLRTRTGHGRI